jgi:hypothetical protein
VVTANVALVVPAATVTLDATCAEALLEDNATTAPPGGAGAAKVTVPVEELPPISVFGLKLKVLVEDGLIVRTAVCVPL